MAMDAEPLAGACSALSPADAAAAAAATAAAAAAAVFVPVKRRLPPSAALFSAGNAAREALAQLWTQAAPPIDALGDDEAGAFPCNAVGCTARFRSSVACEAHYQSCHRFRCSVCRAMFPSSRFLDVHFSERHDAFFRAQARRAPMYECLVEACGRKFATRRARSFHLVDAHAFPRRFRLDGFGRGGKRNALQAWRQPAPECSDSEGDEGEPQHDEMQPESGEESAEPAALGAGAAAAAAAAELDGDGGGMEEHFTRLTVSTRVPQHVSFGQRRGRR